MSRHATAITTTHRINANALQVLDSNDEASCSENATALTGGGFNTGVPRLWCAIATRSVAIAGEKFHEIQGAAFTMYSPAQVWVPLEGFRSSGGKPIAGFRGKFSLAGCRGEGGGVRTGHDRDQNEGIDFGQVTWNHGLDF